MTDEQRKKAAERMWLEGAAVGDIKMTLECTNADLNRWGDRTLYGRLPEGRKVYRIEETALHHSVYEVEAEDKVHALRLLQRDYEQYLVEEFWGETQRDITEKIG